MDNKDIQRLIEKYFGDLRHIETERHWFLGAYAVVVAGVLAFLAQTSVQRNYVWGFGVLTILSFFGFLHALRSARTLELVQNEVERIVTDWRGGAPTNDVDWQEHWMWPSMRGIKPKDRWWKDLKPWEFPPTFTTVGVFVYVFGFTVFAIFMGANIVIWKL